mmetsp:Transcript_2159/g.3889  ORF Transcript_2159/g.3889 Transcript_2159/m.3889 type:complete len:173 (+) Transcript_2159:2632-3150(+)
MLEWLQTHTLGSGSAGHVPSTLTWIKGMRVMSVRAVRCPIRSDAFSFCTRFKTPILCSNHGTSNDKGSDRHMPPIKVIIPNFVSAAVMGLRLETADGGDGGAPLMTPRWMDAEEDDVIFRFVIVVGDIGMCSTMHGDDARRMHLGIRTEKADAAALLQKNDGAAANNKDAKM